MQLAIGITWFLFGCAMIVVLKVLVRLFLSNSKLKTVAEKETGIYIVHGMRADGNGNIVADKRLNQEAARSL